MVKVYIYACHGHEKAGRLVRVRSPEENEAFRALHEKNPKLHLTSCWVQGCQNEGDRVVLVEVASPKAG